MCGLGLEVSCHAAAPASSCFGIDSWESPVNALWQLSEGTMPIFVEILEELVTKSYCLLFSGDNSPIFNDESWSERWEKVLLDPWASCMAREMVCHITAGQKGPLCLRSTSQEHQCSSLWSFGLEFTPSRHCLGQTPMSALAGGCLWEATSLGVPWHGQSFPYREDSRTVQDSWVSTSHHKCCYNPTQGTCHCILKAWRLPW